MSTSSSQTDAPPTRIDHDAVFTRSTEHEPVALTCKRGQVPTDLDGTFLRNGPGAFAAGPDPLHFFDGYGLVAAATFQGGQVLYRARFVQSPVYRLEQAAGRQLRRRNFTNLPERWRNLMNGNIANPVMHDVVAFGGRVVATDDGGHFRLDPTTLDTLGPERWGDRVGRLERMCPVPHTDPLTKRLIGHRTTPGATRDRVTFYEFDHDWKVVREVPHTLHYGTSLTHEVAFTEHHHVVVEMPLRLELGALLWGERTPFGCLVPRPGQPLMAHLVPRDPSAGHPTLTVPLPGDDVAHFHTANAFAHDGSVIFDAVSYPWLDFASLQPPSMRKAPLRRTSPTPTLRRTRIDLATGQVRSDPWATRVEFPRIEASRLGRPHRYVYAVQANEHDASPDPFVWATTIARLDTSTGSLDRWDFGPAGFPSQPAFAPRRGATDEGDGYLVVAVVDLSGPPRSRLAVLDAQAVAKGPVAWLELPGFLGLSSHTRWTATAL